MKDVSGLVSRSTATEGAGFLLFSYSRWLQNLKLMLQGIAKSLFHQRKAKLVLTGNINLHLSRF